MGALTDLGGEKVTAERFDEGRHAVPNGAVEFGCAAAEEEEGFAMVDP